MKKVFFTGAKMLCSLFASLTVYFLAPATLLSLLPKESINWIKYLLPNGFSAIGLTFILFLSWTLALLVFSGYLYKLLFQKHPFKSEKYTILGLAFLGPILAVPMITLLFLR